MFELIKIFLCRYGYHAWEEVKEFEKPGPDPRNPIGHEVCQRCGDERYIGKFGGDLTMELEVKDE